MISKYVDQIRSMRRNTTGNARSGRRFTTVKADGGVYHVYEGGERVFVPKPSMSRGKPGAGLDDLLAALRADPPSKGVVRPRMRKGRGGG